MGLVLVITHVKRDARTTYAVAAARALHCLRTRKLRAKSALICGFSSGQAKENSACNGPPFLHQPINTNEQSIDDDCVLADLERPVVAENGDCGSARKTPPARLWGRPIW